MAYAVRPLEARDIPQTEEIEKEAFPTTWPPTSFKKELSNGIAAYLVACRLPEGGQLPFPASRGSGDGRASPEAGGVKGFLIRLRRRLVREIQAPLPEDDIAGYVGIWFMADEAHITAIASQQAVRGQGVGELLLMATVELAMKRGSRVVTLEVRVSNHVAQSLYTKYGFSKVGLRKGYYSDNHEDAYIMTTAPLDSPSYSESFRRLVESYKARRGDVALVLGSL